MTTPPPQMCPKTADTNWVQGQGIANYTYIRDLSDQTTCVYAYTGPDDNKMQSCPQYTGSNNSPNTNWVNAKNRNPSALSENAPFKIDYGRGDSNRLFFCPLIRPPEQASGAPAALPPSGAPAALATTAPPRR